MTQKALVSRRLNRTARLASAKPRPLVCHEEAGSPIVGAILMVAVTLVMSSVIFFLVTDLTMDNQAPPATAFLADRKGVGGQVDVVMVSGTVLIEDLEVTPTTCTFKDMDHNNKTQGPLVPGDYWSCPNDGTFTIIYKPSNTLLYKVVV